VEPDEDTPNDSEKFTGYPVDTIEASLDRFLNKLLLLVPKDFPPADYPTWDYKTLVEPVRKPKSI
jgi:hypothetical protein